MNERTEEAEEVIQQYIPRYGPVAWCNRCSRRHQRRACYMERGVFLSKAGHLIPVYRNVRKASD